MNTSVSYGYLRPRDVRFSGISLNAVCETEVADANLEVGSRPDLDLRSWGRGNDVLLNAEFTVDLSSIAEDCDLPPSGARLGAVIRWNCPTTSIRGFGTTIPLSDGVCRPSATIPGDRVAGAVTVEVDVVLLSNPLNNGLSAAPTRPGSVLWSREARIHLEGVGATIQTVPYDFAEKHETDPLAMWRIALETDPEIHVTRAIRVCLNTGNKVTKTALDNMNSGKNQTRETRMWQRFLDIDVRTHLLWAAIGISQEYDLSDFEHDEESYGQTLYALLTSYFPGEDPVRLLQKAATDPSLVASRVQSNYGDEE